MNRISRKYLTTFVSFGYYYYFFGLVIKGNQGPYLGPYPCRSMHVLYIHSVPMHARLHLCNCTIQITLYGGPWKRVVPIGRQGWAFCTNHHARIPAQNSGAGFAAHCNTNKMFSLSHLHTKDLQKNRISVGQYRASR